MPEQRNPNSRLLVFHASFSRTPPHELEPVSDDPNQSGFGGGFHAGTEKAALDRIRGLYKQGFDTVYGLPLDDSTMHTYEVHGGVDSTIHDDPMASRYFKNSPRQRHGIKNEPLPELPTNRDDKVFQYRNLYEDPGSTSFFIPRRMVEEGKVTHLSSQFVDPRPPRKPRKGSKAYEKMMNESQS